MERLQALARQVRELPALRHFGEVTAVQGGVIHVSGLGLQAALGDRVAVHSRNGQCLAGEIVSLQASLAAILPEAPAEGLSLGARVELLPALALAPAESWVGRIVDPLGQPLDGRPLRPGVAPRSYRASPPAAAGRNRLGARLDTGLAVLDTLLPLVRGQRMGLFAGSGVGKSTLLAQLARNVTADLVVIAMIGERGRELREFVEDTLGAEGMARSIVVAATSDQSPLMRRRCAWAAMAVAEHFRDQGRHVLLLADSITRFAEAHREIALAAGESPSYRGFPPSTAHLIMSLAERSGPGPAGLGDITAIFSVLVAGSDMEEPVADILRGTLDGHVVLDRAIAERGRFPAIDVLRSVSRALPQAASAEENARIARTRNLLGTYAESELMIRAGLYAPGSDPRLDEAVRLYPALDHFLTRRTQDTRHGFRLLDEALSGRVSHD